MGNPRRIAYEPLAGFTLLQKDGINSQRPGDFPYQGAETAQRKRPDFSIDTASAFDQPYKSRFRRLWQIIWFAVLRLEPVRKFSQIRSLGRFGMPQVMAL